MFSNIEISKVRISAIALAGMATAISIYLLSKAIDLAREMLSLSRAEEFVPSAGDVALVVGVATLAVTVTAGTIVGLIALAGQIATDAPPPSMPASTHEKTVELLANKK